MSDLKSNIVDVIENWDLPYTLGNSIFHVLNSKNDGSNELSELEKALWFLQKRMESLESLPKEKIDKIKLDNINFKCISLKEREDRRNWVNSHLPNFGIIFEYHDAFRTNDKYENLKFPSKYTGGHIGCTTSHYDVIKTYSGNKILGIFEDDVKLSDDFNDRMKYIEDNFNLDWDIFFLSSFYHLNDDPKFKWHKDGDFELTDIKYIHRVYGSFCAHAYLINPKSIDKIIKLMEENLHDSYAIDHLYILIQPYLNCFSFTPGMATQIQGHSTIDNKPKNQADFERIVGKHYYADNLKDFNYDEYFKKYKK